LLVALGYYVRFLPVAVLLVVPGLQRVQREIEAAARTDGCGWGRLNWDIRRPAVAGDLAVAWLVVYILSVAEVGASVLLQAPGWETASIRAFSLLHFGVYRDLAVLALVSAAGVLLPWGLLLWMLKRRGRRATPSS
jgi:iron(III) transport system permease protein